MVSTKVRQVVWGKGAGRCHFCNTSLIGDLISGTEDATFGFIAHIVADTPTGPRGDPIRSLLLANEPSNLMLLCYPHHKLVDVERPDDYPENVLQKMKQEHEERVEIVSAITPDRSSHVLRYAASIGAHDSPVSFERVRVAMLPQRYPADGRSIGIEIIGNAVTDAEDVFWTTEPENLRRQFERQVRPRIANREISHLSVFGLGPMPLLVQLGALLGEIVPADVFQLHREPKPSWRWAEDGHRVKFNVERPTGRGSVAALKLAVSGTITDDRITDVLGPDVPIWSVTADPIGNDVMRHVDDLRAFRSLMRRLFDEIKAHHGEHASIHVCPAIPVSLAIELGRVRMPKSDLPLLVYDNIRDRGFVPRLEIR